MKRSESAARAALLITALKKMYPTPKSELTYDTPVQFLVAVMLSAQCTDKAVNKTTDVLFKKYKSVMDFARAKQATLERELRSVTYFRAKTRHVIAAAKILEKNFKGYVPRTEKELVTLPGVGYKTAHVVMQELFGIYEGIPTDTHVKRFAYRFDLSSHTDLKKISKDLEALIPKKDWRYVNNGFVLYGRYICKARYHDCRDHPLTKLWPQVANRWPTSV